MRKALLSAAALLSRPRTPAAHSLAKIGAQASMAHTAASGPVPTHDPEATLPKPVDKMTDADWAARLTREEYRVLRQKGTERPWSSPIETHYEEGSYHCAACGTPLFLSGTKFDSGCGWPSFFAPADAKAITEHADYTHGMVRTEVTCSTCNGHLGHVFEEPGRSKTGLRYCINGVSIKFAAKKK